MRRFAGPSAFTLLSFQSLWDYRTGEALLQRCACSQQGAIPTTTISPSDAMATATVPRVLRKGPGPMETLTHVFRTHPSALRLHHELTICLAAGEAEKAADLASVLAETVKRVVHGAPEHPKATAQGIVNSSNGDASDARMAHAEEHVPPLGTESLEFVLEKTPVDLRSQEAERVVEAFVDGESSAPTSSASQSPDFANLPFWKQTSALRLTLLEASFEMTLPELHKDVDGDSPLSPNSLQAEEHESKWMGLLDEYLTREKDRWGAQKQAVGRVVLTTAQSLGISPIDLHVALHEHTGMRQADGNDDGRLHVLKHCNLIVRGEVPEMMEWLVNGAGGNVQMAAMEELEILTRRMELRGSPMSPQEREMALFELIMTKSKMRYVVGLHRELQLALDKSEALQRLLHQKKFSSGSEAFVQHAVERLNKIAPDGSEQSAEDVELIGSLSTPVLPFTFMLKMCLWFDTPSCG